MARSTTTLTEDGERLREELPDAMAAPVEVTAELFQLAARLSLEPATLLLLTLPRSVRDTAARGIRASVATTALVPHVLAREAIKAADRLDGESGQEDE